MAQIKQNIEEWKNKLEKSLQEKNCVTDLLGKIEEKSGVKRLHIVLGDEIIHSFHGQLHFYFLILRFIFIYLFISRLAVDGPTLINYNGPG